MEKESIFQKAKRYVISAGISFLTGFAIVFLASIDSITMESFKDGAFVGVLFAASRAGVKAVFEAFVAWRAKYQ